MKSTHKISLKIKNNTPLKQLIEILGGKASVFENINRNDLVQWDISGETFPSNEVTLNLPIPITKISKSNDIKGIVDALNLMKVATFLYLGTIIYACNLVDDNVKTSHLQIGDSNYGFYIGTGFENPAYSISQQSDGKMLIGGYFTSYNGTPANRIIRLNSDGTVDPTFVYGTGFDNFLDQILQQSDGKFVIGGRFTSYNGTSANGMIRLNSDGTVDSSFSSGTGFDQFVRGYMLQSDGKIIAVGDFSNYNGTPAPKIIRLNADGTVDGTFVTGTGFTTSVMVTFEQSDGKILVGGLFSTYNGNATNNIIRLNSDGTVDSTFIYGTGFDSGVSNISQQSDGKMLIGGYFTSYNGTPANRIIRLNLNGTVDSSFSSGTGFVGNFVGFTLVQSDGKILVGGNFSSYNGNPANHIIGLNSDGTVDGTFVYGTGFNAYTEGVIENSDGQTIWIGNFQYYNGENLDFIVRLNKDGISDTTII